MGEVLARKASDIAIKKRGDVKKFVKYRDKLFSEWAVDKPWQGEVDHVEDLHPFMLDFRHSTEVATPAAHYGLFLLPTLKTEMVNLGKCTVTAASAAVYTDQQAFRVDMAKLRANSDNVSNKPLNFKR